MLKSRVFLFLSLVIALQLATSCTVLFAGSKATSDGSVFVTHSSDGDGETDPRLVRIPARTYPKGSKRPIYASPESYPRYVGYDKEAAPYHPTAGQKEFIPIGYVPCTNPHPITLLLAYYRLAQFCPDDTLPLIILLHLLYLCLSL